MPLTLPGAKRFSGSPTALDCGEWCNPRLAGTITLQPPMTCFMVKKMYQDVSPGKKQAKIGEGNELLILGAHSQQGAATPLKCKSAAT